MAAKTANLYARIEPETKGPAEAILAALGIPVSTAINMFYKKIIQDKGIPFSLSLNPSTSIPFESDEHAISEMVSKGFEQAKRGEGKSTKKVTKSIREEMKGWQ